jgi:hypothetical protein
MGRGLVEPIDDFRPTNPAVNPPLLEALADDFRRHEFRLRHLVRTMMNSRTYQLSSIANETNRDDQLNFSRAVVYRLQAEKLADAISQLLDVAAVFSGYKQSIRAGQLPGVSSRRQAASGDRFLATFGKPERLLGSEYERSNETTLSQALMLIGSRDLQQRLADDLNFLARLAKSDLSTRELVDQLYWAALSRPPSEEEFDIAETTLGTGGATWQSNEQRAWAGLLHQAGMLRPTDDRFEALQDLAWALINSKEFLFRH